MSYQNDFFDRADDLKGLSVVTGELVCVTADGSDHPLFAPIAPLLQRVRNGLGMDVVYVAQVLDGQRLVRDAALHDPANAKAEHCDGIESTYCAKVLASRAPRAQAPGLPVVLPVVCKGGSEHGTVAVRPAIAGPARVGEARALRSVAQLIALAFRSHEAPDTVDVWESSAAAPLIAAQV